MCRFPQVSQLSFQEVIKLSIIFSGPKRQETKKRPKIGGAELPQIADFEGETLSMLGTIYKNKAQGNFVERNANLIVQICDEKKTKPVGIVKINLGTFIDE